MKKILSIILSLLFVLYSASLVNIVFAENDITYDMGDVISFGSYPQSKVTDEETIASLNKLVPDWKYWVSYGYYSGNGENHSMVQGDWTRYIDVEFGGEKYRAVKFTQYRPNANQYEASYMTEQIRGGYKTNVIYWFKYEPIQWIILDPETGLVLSEQALDAQAFNDTSYFSNKFSYNNYAYAVFSDSSCSNYASDYAASTIRKWLNADFFNTAFSETDKADIYYTYLNNLSYYTLIDDAWAEDFDSVPTEDKVFLLSYDEVLNEKYGFSDNYESDPLRRTTATDYAISLNGSGTWWLRTPVRSWDAKPSSLIDSNTVSTVFGVRPAMRIDFYSGDSDIPDEPVTEPDDSTTEPDDSLDNIIKDCSCMCHKTGFLSFIYKIVNFFWKLFKINPSCACGVNHY